MRKTMPVLGVLLSLCSGLCYSLGSQTQSAAPENLKTLVQASSTAHWNLVSDRVAWERSSPLNRTNAGVVLRGRLLVGLGTDDRLDQYDKIGRLFSWDAKSFSVVDLAGLIRACLPNEDLHYWHVDALAVQGAGEKGRLLVGLSGVHRNYAAVLAELTSEKEAQTISDACLTKYKEAVAAGGVRPLLVLGKNPLFPRKPSELGPPTQRTWDVQASRVHDILVDAKNVIVGLGVPTCEYKDSGDPVNCPVNGDVRIPTQEMMKVGVYVYRLPLQAPGIWTRLHWSAPAVYTNKPRPDLPNPNDDGMQLRDLGTGCYSNYAVFGTREAGLLSKIFLGAWKMPFAGKGSECTIGDRDAVPSDPTKPCQYFNRDPNDPRFDYRCGGGEVFEWDLRTTQGWRNLSFDRGKNQPPFPGGWNGRATAVFSMTEWKGKVCAALDPFHLYDQEGEKSRDEYGTLEIPKDPKAAAANLEKLRRRYQPIWCHDPQEGWELMGKRDDYKTFPDTLQQINAITVFGEKLIVAASDPGKPGIPDSEIRVMTYEPGSRTWLRLGQAHEVTCDDALDSYVYWFTEYQGHLYLGLPCPLPQPARVFRLDQ